MLLLGSENTEALTGPAAVKRAVGNILNKKVLIPLSLQIYLLYFRVSLT